MFIMNSHLGRVNVPVAYAAVTMIIIPLTAFFLGRWLSSSESKEKKKRVEDVKPLGILLMTFND